MRLVGNLTNEIHARRIANYLTDQGISNKCEVSFDPSNGHMSYHLWIHEEDLINRAKAIFKEFQDNPSDAKFDAPEPEPEPQKVPLSSDEPEVLEEPPLKFFGTHVTNFFIALCAILYFLSSVEEMPMQQEGLSEKTFILTPLQALLMYDLPPAYQTLEDLIQKYEATGEKVEHIPPEISAQIEKANTEPYWKGLYTWVVNKIKGDSTLSGEGTMFLRIRQGEIWRLFSPCLLHRDLLHIIFNMLWLWYLGRPIEQRIGPSRTLVLTLVVGVGTNTIQYLMSGPFFIGYSGIITALAGFTWMREKLAPWEGYPLNRATILFLLFFVFAIFGLQLVAFFMQIFTSYNFSPNIANAAHISGAVIGALLARSKFFMQRVPK